MTDQRTLATRLVALRVVKDWVSKADADTRAELLATAVFGDRVTAAVNTADGQVPVGAATITKPRAGSVTASVVDEAALLAWCREHRPTAITETVRLADQRQILDEVKQNGGILDPLDGTITAVPGVIVTEPTAGEPGVMVKPAPDAEAVLREAFASGELRLTDLTPLPEVTA